MIGRTRNRISGGAVVNCGNRGHWEYWLLQTGRNACMGATGPIWFLMSGPERGGEGVIVNCPNKGH